MGDTTLEIDERFTFSASTPDDEIDFSHSEFADRVGTGFNEHGVRKNTDEEGNLESVDVIFEAMEPGPPERRNGVRITEDFLDKVASKDYTPNPPHLKDHNDRDTFSRIGEVREAWFSDRLGKLMLMTRTPNIEGSRNHQEAIARYTHEPPAIRDGSLGFGNNYEAVMNDEGEPEMRDGKFREFSTVNFPGGYDEGGVNTAFVEALDEEADFDRHGGEGDGPDMEELSEVYDEWTSMVNMTERQMEMWEDHPCSDKGVDDGEERRDEFMMLMGQPMESWGQEALQIANRAIDFMATEVEKEAENPENGGPGTCPSRWAVNLLNRGYNPFDGFPSGNPQFSKDEVEVFDDPAGETDKPGENSATKDENFAVDTIQF
jgi:hypothetical protein